MGSEDKQLAKESIFPVIMPNWGLTMEEGKVIEWLVSVGTHIDVGDDIVDIETEKIANAAEALNAGTLRRVLAEPGDTLPVGALLGVIASPDVSEAALDIFVEEFQRNFVIESPKKVSAEDAGPSTVTVAGRRIAYTSSGEGTGVPVLFIHGFGGDSNSWLFNVAPASADRMAYALDLPGHGHSDKSVGEGTLETLVDTSLAFMDELDLDQVHLVGHSMGGAVALELTRRAPQRVTSLALVASAGLGDTINDAYITPFIESESRRELKPVLKLLFKDAGLVTRSMVDDVLKYKRLDGVTDALNTLKSSLFPAGQQGLPMREAMSEFDVPTLVVWGKDDAVIPAKHAEGLPDKVTVAYIEGAGHMPQMEAASEVNRLIGTHLKSTT